MCAGSGTALRCPQRPEGGSWSWGYRECKLPGGCWELNSGPLKEQPVLSLLSQSYSFWGTVSQRPADFSVGQLIWSFPVRRQERPLSPSLPCLLSQHSEYRGAPSLSSEFHISPRPPTPAPGCSLSQHGLSSSIQSSQPENGLQTLFLWYWGLNPGPRTCLLSTPNFTSKSI